MIAWYSRDRSWFNRSISSGRDTFLKPPAVVSSFKAISSRVECGNYFRTFRSLKYVGSESPSPYLRTSHQNCAKRNSPATTDASDDELASLLRLNLLERRLVDSHTTVIIPLDDRVLFVSSLNCAEFSIRLSEVAQTLDAISGSQPLIGGGGLGERWSLGAI